MREQGRLPVPSRVTGASREVMMTVTQSPCLGHHSELLQGRNADTSVQRKLTSAIVMGSTCGLHSRLSAGLRPGSSPSSLCGLQILLGLSSFQFPRLQNGTMIGLFHGGGMRTECCVRPLGSSWHPGHARSQLAPITASLLTGTEKRHEGCLGLRPGQRQLSAGSDA